MRVRRHRIMVVYPRTSLGLGVLLFGKELPRAWDVIEEARVEHATAARQTAPGSGKSKGKGKAPAQEEHVGLSADVLRGCKRVVVIGVHGWFPGSFPSSLLFDVVLLISSLRCGRPNSPGRTYRYKHEVCEYDGAGSGGVRGGTWGEAGEGYEDPVGGGGDD